MGTNRKIYGVGRARPFSVSCSKRSRVGWEQKLSSWRDLCIFLQKLQYDIQWCKTLQIDRFSCRISCSLCILSSRIFMMKLLDVNSCWFFTVSQHIRQGPYFSGETIGHHAKTLTESKAEKIEGQIWYVILRKQNKWFQSNETCGIYVELGVEPAGLVVEPTTGSWNHYRGLCI